MGQDTLSPEAHIAIAHLITRFFWCLDNGVIDEAALMFTDQAWLRMGVPGRPAVQGPDGVHAMFSVRPVDRVVRHHWSSLMIISAAQPVHATFQFTAYTGAKDEAAPPRTITIGDVDGLYQLADDGRWRFANMDRSVVFDT